MKPNINSQIKKTESLIRKAIQKDKVHLFRKLNRFRKKPDDKNSTGLDRIQQQAEDSIARKKARLKGVPKIIYNKSLPIYDRKDEIIQAIKDHQVIVLSGETGSGKTTQIPKFCLAAGRGIHGKIGCTQPRRIAAITVSGRISEEMGNTQGTLCGYKIRFQDKSVKDSYIKIMTDGILLAEAQNDRFLNEYDTIIIDEAHERSLNIDFLLGILRNLLKKRKDLKVIITSATIDTKKFSEAFDQAPIIEVSGRTFPVEVIYVEPEKDDETGADSSHVEQAVKQVDKLQFESPYGDILIFMPTEADIRETCELLQGRRHPHVKILPLYARLSAKGQSDIFKGFSGRKIIVATNVAETSITIPGIKFVIDTGLARIARYIPRTRTKALPVMQISKSSADQRKGRCGRVENGICIRLYDEKNYLGRSTYTPPEILRSNLAEVILRMISLKLGDISNFPFIDRPKDQSIKDGIQILIELGAVYQTGKSHSKAYRLTRMGAIMAKLPIDPRLSRILIESAKRGSLKEALIIISALSISDVRERPAEKAQAADQMHAEFKDPDSDFVTILNIWNTYHKVKQELKQLGKLKAYCRNKFISFKRMREWRDIHFQISETIRESRILRETGHLPEMKKKDTYSPLYTSLHKALLTGLLSNIAFQKEKHMYQATKEREAMIFPGSGIFGNSKPWIMAAEMIETSRLFARTAANIDPDWLEEAGGDLCTKTYYHPHWSKKRGEVVCYEQVTLFGLIIIGKRQCSYGKINPEEATEIFIRSALVGGESGQMFPFLKYNLKLVKEIDTLESRLRTRDILIDDEDQYLFYADKVHNISDIRTFAKFLKKGNKDKSLRMNKEDLYNYTPDHQTLTKYPEKIKLGNSLFKLKYKFEPGDKNDGVTLRVPATESGGIEPGKTDWMIPGLLKEKVTELIKTLPKEYRRSLVPVSDTVTTIINEMPETSEPIVSALGSFINKRFHVSIPSDAWSEDILPEHLRMRFEILDMKGNVIKSGRQKSLLKHTGSETDHDTLFKQKKREFEITNVTEWNFGDLEDSIEISGPGNLKWVTFPALFVENDIISLKLIKDKTQSEEIHRKGVRELYCKLFSRDIKSLKKEMKLSGHVKKQSIYFGGHETLQTSMLKAVKKNLLEKNIRKEKNFQDHAEAISPHIYKEGQSLLKTTTEVIESYHHTVSFIHSLELKSVSNPSALSFLNGLRHDIKKMLPNHFPLLYPRDRLSLIIKYLAATEKRAGRGYDNPEKDKLKAEPVTYFNTQLNEILCAINDQTSSSKQKTIEEFYWMIEEFKVSIFAQELKTSVKISEKRLKNKLSEINRMI